MKPFKQLINYLDGAMQRSLSGSAHQLVVVGAIAFLGFPAFYWLWTVLFPQPYESLTLSLIASMLGFGLLLSPYWPEASKPYIPWYWFFALLYSLAFFFAYSFLMNHANVTSSMWLLCSVFLLVLLVDLRSLSVMLIIGWILALLCYYTTSPRFYIGEEHVELGLTLIFVLITSATVNYRSSLFQQQRMAGMAAAAGMIAHELRTPLLGIKSGTQALSSYLPALFEAYQIAKDNGLLSSSIRDSRLKQLQTVNSRIISEIDYANTIIDMLLIKAGKENTLENCTLEISSMSDCLQETMSRYPFQSTKEKKLISYQGDFKFMGSKLLTQHVLFNLIKNALYAIATAQRGEIHIWSETDKKFNYLYVQDTAKGISSQQLLRLFEHFYTTKFMGTGIGLSFCKLVLERFGGNISCEAEEGLYTKFKLSFPLIGEE